MRVLRVLLKPVGPHAPSWLRGLSQRLHFNSHPHLLVNLFFSWSFAISFIVGMSMHFVKGVGSETETTASTGVAAFFAWLRLTNYLRVTKTFGPFVISIGTCVTELFKRWALVACFVFMAFACIIASLQSEYAAPQPSRRSECADCACGNATACQTGKVMQAARQNSSSCSSLR